MPIASTRADSSRKSRRADDWLTSATKLTCGPRKEVKLDREGILVLQRDRLNLLQSICPTMDSIDHIPEQKQCGVRWTNRLSPVATL